MKQPRIIILAGPNGAGKTTFAREFLPREAGCAQFINADLIAAGLSPFKPERAAIQAGRLMLQAIAQHVARRESFAIETTLSGLGYAKQIPQWRRKGFRVELVFLGLPTVEAALERVAKRVRQGGHASEEATIRRRFLAGRRLFADVYQPLVDEWLLFENSGDKPVLIQWSAPSMTTATEVREPESVYGVAPARPPLIQGAMAALQRAALAARKIAQQTGTELVVVRNGVVMNVSPFEPEPAAPDRPGDAGV